MSRIRRQNVKVLFSGTYVYVSMACMHTSACICAYAFKPACVRMSVCASVCVCVRVRVRVRVCVFAHQALNPKHYHAR